MTTEDSRIRLLVVDDEQSIRRLCMTVGSSLEYVCSEAESAEAALAQSRDPPDIVIADLRLPNLSGAELLRQIKSRLPATEVVIMTGHGSIESAVEAMKLGAYDYIQKPFRVEELRMLLRRMEEKIRLVQENRVLRERVETDQELDGIIGDSAKIREILRMISRLKDTWTPVLICGESGTGKELVARAIHYRGTFAKRPFVAVDCGALVPTLMESDLFRLLQRRLYGSRQIQDRSVSGGGRRARFSWMKSANCLWNCRPSCFASCRRRKCGPWEATKTSMCRCAWLPPPTAIWKLRFKRASFRKDLFFRLNVVSITLPPLRERRSDIPMLAQYFLDRLAGGRKHKVHLRRHETADALRLARQRP